MLMMNIRGVSPVVATVLLLVLTIIIGAVVFSVVIPFVNDKLGDSKDCLDVFEGVEFPESKFNCVIPTTPTVPGRTGFSVKVNKDIIKSVRVALIDSNGGSQVYDLSATPPTPGLTMVGSGAWAFPSTGGQKSYFSSGVYEKAEISALTASGDVCSVADVVEFEICDGSVNF